MEVVEDRMGMMDTWGNYRLVDRVDKDLGIVHCYKVVVEEFEDKVMDKEKDN